MLFEKLEGKERTVWIKRKLALSDEKFGT